MKIGYDAFIAKAYEITAADQKKTGGVQGGVGLLDGRLVTVSETKSGGTGSLDAAKSRFLEAAVAEFGEKHRAELQKAVYGDGGKSTPLSARTILSVEHMIHGPNSMVRRLTGIMNRAALISSEARVRSADVDKMFSVFKKGGQQAEAFFRWQDKLASSARVAEKKLNELLNVKPAELATVFDKNPVEAVKQKFKAALDAQLQLEGELKEFDRKTGGRINGVDVLYTRASAKAAELFNLAAELSVMEADKRTGANLKDMFSKQALTMHGNDYVLAKAEEKIAPILARATWAKVNAKNDGFVSCAATATVLAELESAKQAMIKAANGIVFSKDMSGGAKPSSVWKTDSTFFNGVVKTLDEAAADLKAVNDRSAKDALVAFTEMLYPGTKNAALAEVRIKAAAWARDPGWSTSRALAKACNAAYDAVKGTGAKSFVKNLPDRLESMRKLFKEGKMPAGYKSDKMLSLLLERRLDVKTVVLARAWGATDDMVDPEISDKNLLSSESAGKGQSNTVLLCNYKGLDGEVKQYIFKPEIEADIGFGTAPGTYEGYRDLESVAHLNAASKKVAEALGTPNAVTGVKVGCLKGKFGLFMEVAKGVSIQDMAKQDWEITNKKIRPKDAKDWGTWKYKSVSDMDPRDFFKLSASYMRAGTDLEWNDWLTGQVDRHWGNYLMDVDDKLNVSIKGIDNDLAFPSWRIGMTRFRVAGNHIDIFAQKLNAHGSRFKLKDATYESFKETFGSFETFEFNDKDKSFTFDLSKADLRSPRKEKKGHVTDSERVVLKALRESFGTWVAAKPDAINKAMFDNLMELDKNREEFAKSLSPHVGKDGIKAMFMRLDEMVAHAKELEKSGRVMREEDWQNEGLVKSIAEDQVPEDMKKVSQADLDDFCFRLGIYQRDFQSYYHRPLSGNPDESEQKVIKA